LFSFLIVQGISVQEKSIGFQKKKDSVEYPQSFNLSILFLVPEKIP